MSQPLRLSLSQAYTLRWPRLSVILNGSPADPRETYTPEFHLVASGAANFGAWTSGQWESNAPPNGPYAAVITVGVGQPVPVNPGVAGTYVMWARLVSPAETPAFQVGTVVLSVP